MTLVETYKKRLTVAESVYKRDHNNEPLSHEKKVVIASVLNNTSKFLNEAFNATAATQASSITANKKFILNLNTIALPNLIAFDLVMVKPMNSRAGYVQYLEYSAGIDKGGVKTGDVFNNPFALGEMTEDRSRYSGSAVVEEVVEAGKTAFDAVAGTLQKYDGSAWVDVADVATLVKGDKVKYIYDNETIPQSTIPTIRAELKDIALVAKARRLAVYYSQIAAFDLKAQTGEDLDKNISEQAIAELKYEIDTEVILFLKSLAGDAAVSFSKTLPTGVSKKDHYESFKEVVQMANTVVYNKTKKYMPNYMVCAQDVIQVLSFCSGWKAADIRSIAGPYLAGTLDGLKVFVSPTMGEGEFFLGVNEGMTSAAVYAPYMTIVPTQLLGFADGTMAKGFSTMYALAALNKDLVVAGKVTA